jgi:hypothetical protein
VREVWGQIASTRPHSINESSDPQDKCPATGDTSVGAAPDLDPVGIGMKVAGRLAKGDKRGSGAKIRICVDGKEMTTTSLDADGIFVVSLDTALKLGQTVTVQQVVQSDGTSKQYGLASDPATVGGAPTAFDWGRVRAYFSAGSVFSQDNSQFSKAAIYLNFNVDDTWYLKSPTSDWGLFHSLLPKQINTSFEGRLTSLPVTSCPQGANSMQCSTTNTTTFNTTPKAALVSVSTYFPYYAKWSSWTFNGHRHALFVALIGKGGFQTLVESAQTNASGSGAGQTNPATTINGQTFFHFAAPGGRFGLYRFHDESGNSIAPDQLLYLDITYGKYENFSRANTNPTTNVTTYDHPFRLALEGRFTVPKLPIFVGFDSNTRVGSSQGDLRFLFGAILDIGCVFQKLGVSSGIGACDNNTQQQASTPTNGNAAKKP